MTQQEFIESLEVAMSWMRTIQERLKANDNTQGPRDALEVRLRETEKIHQSQHEGCIKMDMALVAAENLLLSGDEELKSQTQTQLKDLKTLWEETCTYIIHCHSRIEWVWLHWSEYLKAYEEFELWVSKQQRSLDVRMELQVGMKEKLWQVDQQRVVVSNIHSHAVLLERLLDEATALHNRTLDPSVEPCVQERLQESYNNVRDRAEEHLSLLHRIAEEHQTYQGCVKRFQSWLLTKTKELTDLMEREDTPENKLKALQALDNSVAGEEKTLLHIEGLVETVRGNTSPAGAEVVVEEAEELRLGWQRLRHGLCKAEEGLRSSLDSHSQYVARCQRLGEDIGHLRVLIERLDQELEENSEAGDYNDQTEEQIVDRWRKYMGLRNTLAGEESQVELLKAQLKELFRFSEDSRHLSDDVLAVVKEHQTVKSRVTKLCSQSDSDLRNILQDPLLVYAQWSHMVSEVLEASADVTDYPHITVLVQSIEHLLKDSVQLQERFSLLQMKEDLLDSVFGPERSECLQHELSAAIKNRELLHSQLLQRKNRLQGLISRTKDFVEAYEFIVSKMAGLQDRLVAADGLQPDILAKKSQSDQFRVIQKELDDCEVHIITLKTLVSSSQSNRTQFERLYADWTQLHSAVKVKVRESEESILDHESFHDSLLNMEKWLMVMKQKLDSFHNPSGDWSLGQQHGAEKALGEFPEKELQLHQIEVQGQKVLEKTSLDGQVHIVRDLKHLQESWLALYNWSLNLHKLLNSSAEQTEYESRMVRHNMSQTESGLEDQDEQMASEHSRNQRVQQQDKSTAVHSSLADSAAEREGEHARRMNRGEDHLSQSGRNKHLSPPGTGTDTGHSIKTDKVNCSAHIKELAADKSVNGNKSAEGEDSSILAIDKEAFLTKSICGEESPEAGEGLNPGGGASMLFRKGGAMQPIMASTQQTMEATEQYISRRKAFEIWLSKESDILSGILSTKPSTLSPKKLKIHQDTLRSLRGGVVWGQDQFQLLLQERQAAEAASGQAEEEDFEELRYCWMLHKSKLKDVRDIRARTNAKRIQAKKMEPAITAKIQKKSSLLQRVCRLALPLWLFLLALLLLAFLLPLMGERNSCSLSNNFARSFNIMLRYEGPPPT